MSKERSKKKFSVSAPEKGAGIKPSVFHDIPDISNSRKEVEVITEIASTKALKITSAAFSDGECIPLKYTCDGNNVNPSLTIENIPAAARSLVLIVDDPDAPIATWVHWVAWDIPVKRHIKENETQGTQDVNDFQENKYDGPCPPSGTHRYFFKIYALHSLLYLAATSKKTDLEKAMKSHILRFGELVGLYKRSK